MADNKWYLELKEKGLLDERFCASSGMLDGPEGNGMAALLVCGNTLRIFPMSFRGLAEEPIAEYDLGEVELVKYRKGILGGLYGLLVFSAGGKVYRLTQSSTAKVLAELLKSGSASSAE